MVSLYGFIAKILGIFTATLSAPLALFSPYFTYLLYHYLLLAVYFFDYAYHFCYWNFVNHMNQLINSQNGQGIVRWALHLVLDQFLKQKLF